VKTKNEEIMKKDLNLDKNSPLYVPTYQEMGYTTEHFESLNWELAETTIEWNRREEAFKRRHREKLAEKKKEEKTMKMQAFVDHWYSTLNSTEVGLLIDDSRKLADAVFDRILQTEKLPAMRSYYENLRMRVIDSPFKVLPADLKKLSRFPQYDHGTKKLTGSIYSFVKLWSHVFSVRRNRGNVLST